MLNVTPWSSHPPPPREGAPLVIEQGAGWALEPVWLVLDFRKCLVPTWIQASYRPGRNQAKGQSWLLTPHTWLWDINNKFGGENCTVSSLVM